LQDVTHEFYKEKKTHEDTELDNMKLILETTCSQAEFVSEEDTDKE